MRVRWLKVTVFLLVMVVCGVMMFAPSQNAKAQSGSNSGSNALDELLSARLYDLAFTGRIQETLEDRLGREIDDHLAELGGLAFHDSLLGLNDDNSCAGCHAAPVGFGDTQSIAIGVENNNIV